MTVQAQLSLHTDWALCILGTMQTPAGRVKPQLKLNAYEDYVIPEVQQPGTTHNCSGSVSMPFITRLGGLMDSGVGTAGSGILQQWQMAGSALVTHQWHRRTSAVTWLSLLLARLLGDAKCGRTCQLLILVLYSKVNQAQAYNAQ